MTLVLLSRIPHGLTSCIALAPTFLLLSRSNPSVFTSNELRYLSWAVEALPLEFRKSTPPDQHPALTLSLAVRRLVEELGLKISLKDYEVGKDDLKGFARKALDELDEWDEFRKPSEEEVQRLLEEEM